jgi:hypothetical protein
VRVASTPKNVNEKNKKEPGISEKTILIEKEEEETLLSASNDSSQLVFDASVFKNIKEPRIASSIQVKEKQIAPSKSIKKVDKKADTPLNYYAKWALTMGLISLMVVPFIIPIILGPMDIALGIIALIQTSKSGEKGIGRGIYALIIGIIFTTFLLIKLSEAYLVLSNPAIIVIVIGVLLFNFIGLILIKKGKKNPVNKGQIEKRIPINKKTKRLLNTSCVFAVFMAALSFLVIGLAFGPITWILSKRVLARMPKDGRSLRLFELGILVLGILATLILLALVFFHFYLDMFGMYFELAIIITLILAALLTIIGFIIVSFFPKDIDLDD